MDEVKIAMTRTEVVPSPPRKRHRLREVAQVERGVLDPVPAVFQFKHPRLTHGELIVERFEARKLRQRHPLVENWVRRAAEHLDRVTKIDESFGEVPGVHALPTNVWFSPI